MEEKIRRIKLELAHQEHNYELAFMLKDKSAIDYLWGVRRGMEIALNILEEGL